MVNYNLIPIFDTLHTKQAYAVYLNRWINRGGYRASPVLTEPTLIITGNKSLQAVPHNSYCADFMYVKGALNSSNSITDCGLELVNPNGNLVSRLLKKDFTRKQLPNTFSYFRPISQTSELLMELTGLLGGLYIKYN